MKLEAIAIINAGVFSLCGWLFKRQIDRVDELEKNIMTEEEIRQLVNDMQKPVEVEIRGARRDLTEIKADVKELIKSHSSK